MKYYRLSRFLIPTYTLVVPTVCEIALLIAVSLHNNTETFTTEAFPKTKIINDLVAQFQRPLFVKVP